MSLEVGHLVEHDEASSSEARYQHRRRLSLNERRWVLLLGDALASLAAATAGVFAWHLTSELGAQPLPLERALWIPILAGSWLLIAALSGASGVSDAYMRLRPRTPVVVASGLHLGTYLIWYFFASTALPRVSALVFEVAVIVTVIGWRRLWLWVGGREGVQRRAIIASDGDTGRALAEFLEAHPELGLRVVGFVRDVSTNGHRDDGVLGSFAELPELVDRLDVGEVIVDFQSSPPSELLRSVVVACERGATISRACERLESLTGRVHVAQIGDDWGMTLPLDHRGAGALYLGVKRATDIVGGLLGSLLLVLLAPPIALAIKLDSPGPVFYRQHRTGRGGRPFSVVKFRSMHVHDADPERGWVDNGERPIGRVGRILRPTHLDELPQFWNVLRGDMSLVGPRPVPVDDERLGRAIVPFYGLRYAVKPGLCGWASVKLKRIEDDTTATQRVEYDLYYIKHQSLWLDARVLAKALRDMVLLRGK